VCLERVIKNKDEPIVMVRPFTMVPNVIELSYYSNVLLPHFVLDSVVGEFNSTNLLSHCYHLILLGSINQER
jgi:hypothetical protein